MKGSIHEQDTGRYQAMIDVPCAEGRKRKTKTHDTKDEAERWLMKMNLRLEEGVDVEPSEMPLRTYLEDWLDTKQREVASSTHDKYTWTLDNHVIPELGDVPIADLTPYHLDSLYQKLNEELANNTVRTVHSTLRTALNEAVRQQLIETNPAQSAKVPKHERSQIETLSETEAKQLNKTLSDDNPYEMAIYLSLNTGMRQSEVLGLTWDNVDFGNGLIAVQKRLTQTMGGEWDFGDPKSASSVRSIPMTDKTKNKMKNYQRNQYRAKMEADEWERDGFCFTTKKGTWLGPSNLRRKLKEMQRKLDISEVSFHALRHTYATLMMGEDINPKKVQERLGHSSIDVTLDRYSHVSPTMQREASEKIGNLIE